MRSSTSGLLLLLVAVTVLSGLLTGNLDRWLAYLFDPARPGLTTTLAPGASTPVAGERRAGGVA